MEIFTYVYTLSSDSIVLDSNSEKSFPFFIDFTEAYKINSKKKKEKSIFERFSGKIATMFNHKLLNIEISDVYKYDLNFTSFYYSILSPLLPCRRYQC